MATWLGLGSPGRCEEHIVTHGITIPITRLVDNEFWAILVMGDSTLLFRRELIGFINTDILKEGNLVCHLIIAIPYCSRYCYTKYIYKDMIQVYWFALVGEELYYLRSENKGADQLHGYRIADLPLCFRICKIAGFPMTLLI